MPTPLASAALVAAFVAVLAGFSVVGFVIACAAVGFELAVFLSDGLG